MADYTIRRLSPRLQRVVVRGVCAYIRRRCDEAGVPPGQVHGILDRVPVIVATLDVSEGVSTCADPNPTGDLFPILTLHLARGRMSRARVIVHELTEALLYEWVAPALFHCDAVIATDELDPSARRHRISDAACDEYESNLKIEKELR